MNFQIATEPHFTRAHARLDRFGPLYSINWDFPARIRQTGLEAIHPYPAKFIPELPGTLLDLIPIKPGTLVLDPFVGSGTTLVECQCRLKARAAFASLEM
jgi:DNA modification methylase